MSVNQIFTIGYEGANQEDFIFTLKAKHIACLIDVREVPISRRKGFSKKVLTDSLLEHGIRYVHLRGLGDPKEGREAARTGKMDLFREIFLHHMASTVALHDLNRAAALASDATSCLLCYERDPRSCHRSVVAAKLKEGWNLVVKNIGVENRNANGKHSEIRNRTGFDPCQSTAAFGQTSQ
ncbi:MAG: DUF488 domain-containing protein [Magnetococcales bacterium]|nr:DUF488 domain-containing protein [Magnetococcales bacterium]